MSDQPEATGNDRERSSKSVVRSKRNAPIGTLLLAGLAVALAAVVVVMIFTPAEEPNGVGKGQTYAVAEQGDASPKKNARGAFGHAEASQPPAGDGAEPTIQLPSVALPASAEQLQTEAEQVAESLRQQHPNRPRALHVAAMYHSQVRETEKAKKLWRTCIEMDPKQVAYYVNLAAIAMDRGDSQLAADTLQQAIDAGLTTPDVQHHLAVALTKLGRCEEAEDLIREALQAEPEAPAYWTVLGQAQLKLGKASEAETSLKKAIDLGSKTARIYFALGNALARQDKQEEAAKYRERFKELKEKDPLDKQERYEVLSTAEARRTAVTTLCEAALVYRNQQNSLESERLLMRAIVLDPSNPAPCKMLAELYLDAGLLADARVARERLIELEPFRLMNYLRLARLCADLNEPESAEAALKMALAIKPRAIEAYATLAQFYLEQNRAERARWYAQEAIRRQPSAEGYRFLAKTCEAMGDDAAANAARATAESLQDNQP
ncbi:MAG: tetratricopeptide repeat protein [Planctomycetota bacterium]